MATLLLSAAGAALGGSFGGSVLGLTGGAIGKAVGATLGAVIDQRLTGLGSEPVEVGQVDRFRVMGASEGAPLPRVFGRVRVAGQVIWSSRFLEEVNSRNVGGKGGRGAGQRVREYSYSISLAVALCEGEVVRVGRIWADGQPLDLSGVTWRLHGGGEDQLPDPLIAAIEGSDAAPAYRGTAYVVFEDLQLALFGNRLPQFNFEVFRRPEAAADLPPAPWETVRGVALVPGTGEYALATRPVHIRHGKGRSVAVNVNNDRGRPDFLVSLEQLRAELPRAKAVSLVVSWFGDDLRCDRCTLRPAVEQAVKDGREIAWRVSGQGRAGAATVSTIDGRPTFGGTPADETVVQAIRHMVAEGHAVMFYPFILMDILAGNGLGDPWTGAVDQPRVPWRGRITLSIAPGRPGSPDRTAAAAAEVAAFFGAAQATDFRVENGRVVYDGPPEWSYRRFILHYAHLCALAGGVDSFCIGSEMRSLTQIRDGAASYPAVRALRALAADVRTVLGPGVRIGYAADWSEYFGHRPDDGSGNVLFHLDPLWADDNVDFIGIDNYMPLSDWRDGPDHADAAAGSIFDLSYLQGNVAGGEGFDWYYATQADRDAQRRSPIVDSAHGEHWVFRYKDILNWWSSSHHDRPGGVRSASPTAWEPRSKPIWFTEIGCPAIDKGTNQPNVFVDPKSSESFAPHYSNGGRDEYIQRRYLQASYAHWSDPANNPVSPIYGGPMVDLDRAFVWAWDARPWPDFPDRLETWSDGVNYGVGHWLNTRAALPSLAEVVTEICKGAGRTEIDVSRLHGLVTGATIANVESARQSLQPLMTCYGFDCFALGDRLAFAGRDGRVAAVASSDELVRLGDDPVFTATRAAIAGEPGRIAFVYASAENEYQAAAVEAHSPEAVGPDVAKSTAPVVLSEPEARAIAERWLSEMRVARDAVEFALPPSRLALTPGDVVRLDGDRADLLRLDRVDDLGSRAVVAVRIEPGLYRAPLVRPSSSRARSPAVAAPVHCEFLDLPILTGNEIPHAPHVAAVQVPWAGPVAVYSSGDGAGYRFEAELRRCATVGETLEPLAAGAVGLWMNASLRVRLDSGRLDAAGPAAVLNGANALALRYGGAGDWEVLQFRGAELVGPDVYRLSGLLRGQAGTDAAMPDVWPAGTDIVLLDDAVKQLDLPASARGLDRIYRVGPARRGYDDASYGEFAARFESVGLRPYRPAHLQVRRVPEVGFEVRWIRRTRIDGDAWEGFEVPLGEDRELYRVVIHAGASVRERWTETTSTLYTLEEYAADGSPAIFAVTVGQVSDRVGVGNCASLLASA